MEGHASKKNTSKIPFTVMTFLHDTWSRDEKTKQAPIQMGQQGFTLPGFYRFLQSEGTNVTCHRLGLRQQIFLCGTMHGYFESGKNVIFVATVWVGPANLAPSALVSRSPDNLDGPFKWAVGVGYCVFLFTHLSIVVIHLVRHRRGVTVCVVLKSGGEVQVEVEGPAFGSVGGESWRPAPT